MCGLVSEGNYEAMEAVTLAICSVQLSKHSTKGRDGPHVANPALARLNIRSMYDKLLQEVAKMRLEAGIGEGIGLGDGDRGGWEMGIGVGAGRWG